MINSGKKDKTALYLRQSYEDAWADYRRSLHHPSFPVWDYIVLTASDEHQAAGFRKQLEARRSFLPERTEVLVIPDEGGVRVGSGGATLSVLRELRRREESFAGLRILVIHSGGDSRRIPQYSALGKLFSPVPHQLPDGRLSSLFDEILISVSAVPGRFREGMLLMSGDVLLLCNPLLIDYSGKGAACISFKEKASKGKNHGVYLRGESGNVRAFLHKQPEELLQAAGAVNEAGDVDIDTGAVFFGRDMLDALYGLISDAGKPDEEKYRALVNDRVRLSLYGDFQYPLAEDSTLEQFYLEKAEGEKPYTERTDAKEPDLERPDAESSETEKAKGGKKGGENSSELTEARKRIWEALRPFRMKLIRLAPSRFIHFGTTEEVLALMTGEADRYRELGWSRQVCCAISAPDDQAARIAGCYSVFAPGAVAEGACFLEVSYLHKNVRVGEDSVVSCLDVHEGVVIPPRVVLHGLKQCDGRFVCRIYGVEDNPKENRLFGRDLDEWAKAQGICPEWIWERGEAHTLWNAKLYPEAETIREALEEALALYRMFRPDCEDHIKTNTNIDKDPDVDPDSPSAILNADTGIVKNQTLISSQEQQGFIKNWLGLKRKSLALGFHDADPVAILDWNERMRDLVRMNEVASLYRQQKPASQASLTLPSPLTELQRTWLEEHAAHAGYGEAMRLHYYVGKAMGGPEGEAEMNRAFDVLRSAFLEQAREKLTENREAGIAMDEHTVTLPLRVNWGGGWSDTPPYCTEKGGTVLNAAILLDGRRPVRVVLKRLPEPRIILESRDMDAYGVFDSLKPLQEVGDPFDPFVLQKAALLACGIIPAKEQRCGRTELSSGEELKDILTRLGGGFYMGSEVTGVPKGSGLGTSSILAAACVKALFEFMGLPCTEDILYTHVLTMEQIMSTGGGWQDQVGGITDGIKYITSQPGLDQKLRVEHLGLPREVLEELNERFALIYTGQRRLARNLLRDVVGRYIGNEPETVFALNEIQRIAVLMRFELERGHVDDFAELMNRHWELSLQIDEGSSNTMIDQIFHAVQDLLAGRMICGAGGGGFLQVILKKGVTRSDLQKRLKEVFQDTDINVWDCTLV